VLHLNEYIIIGGGISGLTAAGVLSENKNKVVVIEKEKVCGGLSRSVNIKNNVFDFGPHRFHTEDQETLQFIHKILGSESITIERNSKVWLFNNYHNWPLDYHTILKLPLSVMLKSFLDLFRRPEQREETFADYVISKYGRTLYDFFFEPYTKKFLNYPPEELHSDWGKIGIDRAVITNEAKMNNLLDVIKSVLLPKKVEAKFLYPDKGGIQFFSDEIVKRIISNGSEICTDEYPVKIKYSDDSILSLETNKRNYCVNGKIIWTAPLTVLLKLLNINDINLEFLSSIFYNVTLKTDARLKYQWCYYGTDDIYFNRISMPALFSIKNSGRIRNNILCVELAARHDTMLFRNPESIQVKIIEDIVKSGVIKAASDIEDISILKVENTYPIYKKNYKTELEKAIKALSVYKNLHLLGRSGEFWYNNMDHSIKKALTVAKSFSEAKK